MSIEVRDIGVQDYLTTLELQRAIHAGVLKETTPPTLILVEHPSVYTAGRLTKPEERPFDGTPVIDVDRGGKITWHGEGQLVGYPIVPLRKRNEVVGYVREIESGLIDACRELGINAENFCERTGVWIRDAQGDRKIAAIGIRVAKGITMHGFALNVSTDGSAFTNIIPCGISDAGVTSLSKELGREVSLDEVKPIVERHILAALRRVM